MKSIVSMIEQLEGLLGTHSSQTDWEHDFVSHVVQLHARKKDTGCFTPTQVETIERIWEEHFA